MCYFLVNNVYADSTTPLRTSTFFAQFQWYKFRWTPTGCPRGWQIRILARWHLYTGKTASLYWSASLLCLPSLILVWGGLHVDFPYMTVEYNSIFNTIWQRKKNEILKYGWDMRRLLWVFKKKINEIRRVYCIWTEGRPYLGNMGEGLECSYHLLPAQ